MNFPTAELPPGTKVAFAIVESSPGMIGLVGPVDDRPLCYALLELARDLVRDHHAAKAAGARLVAQGTEADVAREAQPRPNLRALPPNGNGKPH